tara:strand:+ start:1130 stop:1327 length:198 start_codon:yes stop_codon:yes gene_type:complete
MTNAQIEARHAEAMVSFHAKQNARGAYFAATMARASSIGNGSATQAQYDDMIKLKATWKNFKAAA